MNARPYLVLVGGFLGAGKTTLILAAARELSRNGVRSAVILNDQSESLVDTRMARAAGIEADEVTGGCFCCRFSELMKAADRLREHDPEVIFAEPVGSCTDISATILQPLQLAHQANYRLAPYTVLVEPERARDLLAAGADPNLGFLFSKQIEEADLVCFTKSDLYSEIPDLDEKSARQISARTGQGVKAWLNEVLSGNLVTAQHTLEIDYEQYARAEAALVWLNLNVTVDLEQAVSPAMLLGPFIDGLDPISIVHLKAIDECSTGLIKVAQCRNSEEPQVEGALDASPALRHELCVNLRALGEPEAIRAAVERQLAPIQGKLSNYRLNCFRPARPQPEFRCSSGL